MIDSAQPLSDSELERLGEILDEYPESLNADGVDGLIAALLCGAEVLPPGRLIQLAFGTDEDGPIFDSEELGQEARDLLSRHWNGVGSALHRGEYQPTFYYATDELFTRDWARGFMKGAKLNPRGAWSRLLADQRNVVHLEPILALADGDDPFDQIPSTPEEDKQRHQTIDSVVANVGEIYRYFEPDRRRLATRRFVGGRKLDADRPIPRPVQPAPAIGMIGGRMGERIGPDYRWEIGMAPVPSFADAPNVRITALLIVATGPTLIRLTLEPDLSADPTTIARLVVREVAAAVEEHGQPPAIWVADQPTLIALRRSNGLRGTVVERRAGRPILEAAQSDYLQYVGGGVSPGKQATPANTWTGWGLAPDTMARLFQASAAVFRAAPWRRWDDSAPLMVRWPSPGGAPWAVTIMGAAGGDSGVVCFLEPEDARAFAPGSRRDQPVSGLRGVMISVLYSHRDHLPAAMRKQMLTHEWEVAAPDAYPLLTVTNGPVESLTEPQAADLASLLEALARLGTRRRSAEWTDRESGLGFVLPAGRSGKTSKG